MNVDQIHHQTNTAGLTEPQGNRHEGSRAANSEEKPAERSGAKALAPAPKMGLVRFLELNSVVHQDDSNHVNYDSSNQDDDEEDSIELDSLPPFVPMHKNKFLMDTLIDSTTEHTVSETSFSDFESSPLFSSWNDLRSKAAAASAAASAAVLAAVSSLPLETTSETSEEAATLSFLHVASDDRVQPEDDENNKEKFSSISNLKRHCLLGEGFLGKVWLVTEKKTTASTRDDEDDDYDKDQECYALKRMSKFDLIDEDLVDSVVRERDLLQTMFHPGIVKLQASFQDERYVYLLQDYCQGGELFSLMASGQQQQQPTKQDPQQPFTEDACRFYTACLTDALWYMHVRKRVVYRDLKPENIMLDRFGYPVLVDFGHARKMETICSRNDDDEDEEEEEDDVVKAFTLCGTPKYVAPEMIQGDGHSFAVDYWALGIILYQLLTNLNQHPFCYDEDEMDDFALYEAIVEEEYMPLDSKFDISPQAANVVDGLLRKDPTERLGAVNETHSYNGILEHPFFDSSKINVGLLRRRLIPAPWVPTVSDALDARHFSDFEDDEDSIHSVHKNKHGQHLSPRDEEKFASF